jgi:insulysin
VRSEIASVTRADLLEFEREVIREGKLAVLVQGNYLEEEARAVANVAEASLGYETLPPSKFPPYFSPLVLPRREKPVVLTLENPNKDNDNSCVEILLQSTDKKDNGVVTVLGTLIGELFYDDLRTKQQLGYIVSSGVKTLGEAKSLAFIVQTGPERSGSYVRGAIEKFISGFGATLRSMREEDIETTVRADVEKLVVRDQKLGAAATRNWAEIGAGLFQFDRQQSEARAMMAVTKSDVVAWWEREVEGAGGGGIRKLVVNVLSKGGGGAVGAGGAGDLAKALGDGTKEVNLGDEGVDALRRELEKMRG